MQMYHPVPIYFCGTSREYLHGTGYFGSDTDVGEI